ncbi:MAG: DUF2628 domain-containing protein [Acetobacteraceae bacterium]|nr:DUF2628 domain-containing protein [Acetobacteraceae bacterium]MDW8399730.1 DUF2628 domain-containing protein [Acetobacteraceae bacterium]
MRVWTIHAPAAPPASVPVTAPRGPVALVREGFSWLALLAPLPWFLWQRMWLVAALWTSAAVIAALLLPEALLPWVAAAVQILTAFHARDLQRWTLARRGLVPQGVIAARNLDAAIARLAELRPDLGRAALASGGVR